MAEPGEHSFDMNPTDFKEMLTQIRTGKQASDFLAGNFHWHQNRYDFQAYSHDHFPADFEIKFAHQAIDQGMDVFVAQGVHTIKGVEIYKGKPIFYGVSNFIFQSAIMPQGKGKLPEVPGAAVGGRGEMPPAGRPGGRGGAAPADPNAIVGEHETQGFWQLLANLEGLLAWSHFENGQLTEVRIYPVDLGQTPRPGSQVGIPKKADAGRRQEDPGRGGGVLEAIRHEDLDRERCRRDSNRATGALTRRASTCSRRGAATAQAVAALGGLAQRASGVFHASPPGSTPDGASTFPSKKPHGRLRHWTTASNEPRICSLLNTAWQKGTG